MEHDYIVPAAWGSDGHPQDEDKILGYLREVRQDGETFLKSQLAYPDITRCMRLLGGPRDEKLPSNLSRAHCNYLKRQIREVVATESNIRPLWGYKTDNDDFRANSEVLNKLMLAWYQSCFADRGIRAALQWAAVTGTGYTGLSWKRDKWCRGRGDIEMNDYGPLDVLPFMMPKSNDLNDCYSVTIIVSTPISLARMMWPAYADRLVPDHDRVGLLQKGMEKVRRFVSPALNAIGIPGQQRETTFPEVDICYTYIMDPSVNYTQSEIPMGRPGSSWFYKVPYVGQDIPAGVNDVAGRMLYRKATEEDAAIYPLRRLITWTNTCRLDDDTSPYWHGKVPAIRFRVDDWPWAHLGYSMMHEGAAMQESHTRLLRLIDDMARAKGRPALAYDSQTVSTTLMNRFDPRQENQRLDVNTTMGDVIKPILPPDYYNIPPWMLEHLRGLETGMNYVTASNDMMSLAKARQMPSSDTIEKFMEMAGPIVQDISRGIEASVREVGDHWKSMAFQFYTTKRKVQILGDRGILSEDYDYDPGNMVPSHFEWEDKGKPSMYSRVDRARIHQDNFHFQITPNSLHQITQMSRKMVYMQLWRAGYPIDWWTLAETMDIPNFGSAPKGTDTVLERWIAQERMKSELSMELQAEVAAKMNAAGIGMPPAPPPKPGGGGGAGHPHGPVQQQPGGPNKGEGRPPSGHAPPKIQNKDGGTRSTVAESR